MAQRKNPDFVLRIVLDQLEERAEGRTNSALYRNSDKERKPTDFLLSPGGPFPAPIGVPVLLDRQQASATWTCCDRRFRKLTSLPR